MNTNCATCGKECVPQGSGTGYGTDAEGKNHCYACCDARQRAEIDTESRFIAYLDSRGERITTWTGGVLLSVVDSKPCFCSRRSNWHGKDFRTIWARNPRTGHLWTGRGSPGVIIRLRRLADPVEKLRARVETEIGIDAGDMTEEECREALREERKRRTRYESQSGR